MIVYLSDDSDQGNLNLAQIKLKFIIILLFDTLNGMVLMPNGS